MSSSTIDKKNAFGSDMGPVTTHAEGIVKHVHLGYDNQLKKNRSLWTILGMALAICAVPYGIGGPLMSAVYGGGQLSMFVGLLVVLVLSGAVAISLAELASRYPTSSGVYYWSYRLCGERGGMRKVISFLTGWFWLIGNWTITLSVNFGFASLIAATVSIYHPEWTANDWQLLLIFYAVCILTFTICAFGDAILPYVDAAAAIWSIVTIIAVFVAVAIRAKEGRHPAAFALGNYEWEISGWGQGFSFFIGLLPPAYAFSAIGMITSLTEECAEPEVEVSRALAWVVPIGGIACVFFILPLCFTMPPLDEILGAPYGQALPYIITRIIGNQTGTIILMVMVLLVTLFCSIGITNGASRCTWAFSRDKAIPCYGLWQKTYADRPLYALALVTVIEMLLGLINLGSSSAFTAFASVGVIALSVGYLVPIAISLFSGRKEVSHARWNCGTIIGTTANVLAVAWIAFQLFLFSMPAALPVDEVSMNYASVVLMGFAAISLVWYAIWGRKVFNGPPEEVDDFM
jgi:amino acid transporter